MMKFIRASMVVMALVYVFSSVCFAADAAEVYKAKCSSCHGADGKGETTMGKNLKLKDLGSADVQNKSDADLTAIIADGKKPMPGYKGKISDEDISGLVKYIRSLKK
jgi:mono/diheme cytochrome c family protein